MIIFEVLSPSTASIDMIQKNQEYAATPSVRRYVLLSQGEIGGAVFERAGDEWLGHILAADAILVMPEIGIEVPLTEFYEGVAFDDAPETA